MAEPTNTQVTPKKKKRKGPIRTEAVVPFLIFVAIVYVYFAFFFDMHLRHAMEFVGTHANGAEVDISDIDTSFWKASLSIKNIQVTDVDQPQKNKVQVGEIRWRMLWDALLRGKIAIADASILEIGIGTPRKKPGYVLPPPPPSSESLTETLREKALDQVQEKFDGNVLGDIAAVLGGADPKEQLKALEANVKSTARIKELQTELTQKQTEWKTRIANLPQAKDLKDLQDRLKTVKLDHFSNPAELQTSLKELDTIFKDADAKVKLVESTGKDLNGDISNYQTQIKDLEAMVKKDIEDIEGHLKIPKLDVKNMAMSLFGPMFLTKVKQAKFYMEKARTYMPPKKTAAEKAEYAPPKPHERIAGRNYKFGRPHAYPLFWLKKAEISSNPKNSEFSGDVSGTLQDVTDDPPTLGLPTVATFKGDFPAQDMKGVLGRVTIDHTTDSPVEKVDLKVADFRLKGQGLIDSPDVQLGFEDARAGSEIKVTLQGESIDLTLDNQFSNIKYNVDAKNNLVKEILTNVINGVPTVTLDGYIRGPWKDLDVSLNSNLGGELQKGFAKEIDAKVAEAKAKVKAMVDEKIGAEKEKLLAQYKAVEGQVKGEITKHQDEINKFKGQIEDAKKKATNDQKKKVESEVKNKVQDLFKGKKLKF
jgi:uncharacterized protein (TIGR03545 family)